jgi:hypothetical protein
VVSFWRGTWELRQGIKADATEVRGITPLYRRTAFALAGFLQGGDLRLGVMLHHLGNDLVEITRPHE